MTLSAFLNQSLHTSLGPFTASIGFLFSAMEVTVQLSRSPIRKGLTLAPSFCGSHEG